MWDQSKSHFWETKSMKHHILLFGLIVGHLSCYGHDGAGKTEKQIWGSSYMRELAPDGKDTRLNLFDVSQGPEHLVGGFALTRQVEGATSRLIIEGHFNKSGEFTPNVHLEVSNREDGNWKTIESSFSEKVDVTLAGGVHIGKLYARIQLDAFKPYIGKLKYCRVTLQTGESDVFPMAWLTEKGE
jgi:hypothetical protein